MVHRNLGFLDRFLRFALAVWWIGPWAPHYANAWVNWAIFVIGWIALAESFLGWCAIHALLGIHECDVCECEECEECNEEEGA
ncbi:MAG: YgaP-like transmembrane domain [Candidatus Uhrbacteria bacterium]